MSYITPNLNKAHITTMIITRRNTVNKENVTNQKVLHTYEKGLPPYKQDLLIYTKKDSHRYTKNPRQIATANSHGRFLRQIPTANSHRKFPREILKYAIHKMVWSNPLCGRASRVKIKRKQVTKQKLWGWISWISKTNISNISEISFSWKWLTPIFFAVIIQLHSRKCAPCGFNVPNCYLKAKAKYEQDKKYFSD